MISISDPINNTEYTKRKLLRLQQVREQSKNIATTIRNKVKNEQTKIVQKSDLNSQRKTKERQLKTLKSLQKDLDRNIEDFGSSHDAIAEENKALQEWERLQKANKKAAIARGHQAAQVLRQKVNQSQPQKKHSGEPCHVKSDRNSVPTTDRYLEFKDRKIQQYYSEEDDSENECSNAFNRENLNPQQSVVPRLITNRSKRLSRPEECADEVESSEASSYTEPSNDSSDKNKPTKQLDPSIYRVVPTETLRQLHTANIPPPPTAFQTYRIPPNSEKSDLISPETLSDPTVFNSVSEYIKNRTKPDTSSEYIMPDKMSSRNSQDKLNIRDTLHHARQMSSRTTVPSIPVLPEDYRRADEALDFESGRTSRTNRRPQYNNHRITSHSTSPRRWQRDISESTSGGDHNMRSTSAKSKNDQSKPLRSILSQNGKGTLPRSARSIRYASNKLSPKALRKAPSSLSDSHKKFSPSKMKPSERYVRCYDQSNHHAKNVIVDSQYLVERLPKRGMDAYESATAETAENDEFVSRVDTHAADQKIRSDRAYEKMRVEKDYKKLLKDLDVLSKEERLARKKTPDIFFMNDDRLKLKQKEHQKKITRAFETALDNAMPLRRPFIPISIPKVVHKDTDTDRDSDIRTRSDDVLRRRPCRCPVVKRKSVKPKSDNNKFGSWEELPNQVMYDDLDEIPTRDSESSVRSLIVALPTKTPIEAPRTEEIPKKMPSNTVKADTESRTVHIPKRIETKMPTSDEALLLFEEQKKKIINDIKKMSLPNNPSSMVGSSKLNPKVSIMPKSNGELSNNSSDNEAIKKSPQKKFVKRRNVSPQVKVISIRGDNQQTQPNNSKAVKEIYPINASVQQLVPASSSSTVSFEGLQIVIEIKKNKKTTDIQNVSEKNVESHHESHTSSNMSIRTSQFVSQKEIRIEKNNNSVVRFDSSESTAYLSPPEKGTTNFKVLMNKRFGGKPDENRFNEITPSAAEYGSSCPENVKLWMASTEMSKTNKATNSMQGEFNDENMSSTSQEVTTVDQAEEKTKKDFSSRRPLVSKGIQVSTSQFRQISQSVQYGKPVNVSETPSIDPMLKKYIKQLLEMSQSKVDNLALTVSDVSTPNSSVINVSSNVRPTTNNKNLSEKIRKLKLFIRENYNLLEELGKESILSSLSNGVSNSLKSKTSDNPSSGTVSSNLEDHKKSAVVSQPNQNVQKKHLPIESTSPKNTNEKIQNIKTVKKNKPVKKTVNGGNSKVLPFASSTKRQNGGKPGVKPKTSSKKMTSAALKSNITKPAKKNLKNSGQSSNKVYQTRVSTTESTTSSKNSEANVNTGVKFKKTKTAHKGNTEDGNLLPKKIEAVVVSSDDGNSHTEKTNPRTQNTKTRNQFHEDLIDLEKPHIQNTKPKSQFQEDLIDLEVNRDNDERYAQLRKECTKRIDDLSQMLNQVRKEKEAILSSSGGSDYVIKSNEASSGSGKVSPKLPGIDDVAFIPILSDIPKPMTNDEIRSNQIDQLRNDILSISKSKDLFLVPAENYDLQPNCEFIDNNKENFNQYDFESFEESPGRQRPPIALIRNPIMRSNAYDHVTPHELSTIIEVDTPITARNASVLSKPIEFSPLSTDLREKGNLNSAKRIDFEQIPEVADDNLDDDASPAITLPLKLNLIDLSIPVLEQTTNVENELKPFLSFREFIDLSNDDQVDENPLGDSTLKAVEFLDESSLSSSENTLPDVLMEMIKRKLKLPQLPSSINSTTHGSIEESSSSLNSSVSPQKISSPTKRQADQPKTQNRQSATQGKSSKYIGSPSISGVHAILDSSSNSEQMELEAALKSIGMGWAVSTLKKTQEAMALSSSSSSVQNKEKRPAPLTSEEKKNLSKKILDEIANMSNSSVGLSTLLDDLNITENLFKEYSAGNISKSSVNKGLELLMNKIDSSKLFVNKQKSPKTPGPSSNAGSPRKFTENRSKSKSPRRKVDKKAPQQLDLENIEKRYVLGDDSSSGDILGSKDKTHQRTSTPVLPLKCSSFSSNVTTSSRKISSGLFGIESDLSSVKNISHTDRTTSSEGLSVPNINLKFGKLFDSTILSDK